MLVTDMHNHTTYSYDGSNTPEELIEHAIKRGIDVLGITDHQFSLNDRLAEYIEHINNCKKTYQKHIRILCGLEIGTRPKPTDFLASMSWRLDYCLFESLDDSTAMDFFEFLEWVKLFRCKVGLAHTDIFHMSERYGLHVPQILKQHNIFWELNVSGRYTYYYDFITNETKRNIVRESGLDVSIGSDTHWIEEFDFKKLKRAVNLVDNLGNNLMFSK